MATTTLMTAPALRRDWRVTLSNALIITRREVRDSFRDWRIISPIVILTFLFPSLAQFVASRFAAFVADYGAEVIGERTIPFLLMIVGFFPISISLVIALETFVGEKERRSLEPLLSTPLTNTELYIGKTLSSMIPPLVASLGGMGVYLASLLFGELAWRPQTTLVIQIVVLTVVQALVMVTGAVVVSSQATSTRAANLLASFIVIPMSLLVQAESVIMFLAPDADSPNGIGALWAIIIGMIVACVLLLRVGNAIFNREELLGRQIDDLNIRRIFVSIGRSIIAVDQQRTPARNPLDWYRRGVIPALGRLRSASLVTVGVFVAAFIGGILLGQLPEWRLPLPDTPDLRSAADVFAAYLNVELQGSAALAIFWQNTRVLLLALAAGIFTFGAGALILTPAVYVILGYILSQIIGAGYNPSFLLAAVLTHGIIEIPVIVIATAAALRLGAVITQPLQGVTIGFAWTMALGDTLKLFLGVILPGLLLAALIESFVTPAVVLAVLGG